MQCWIAALVRTRAVAELQEVQPRAGAADVARDQAAQAATGRFTHPQEIADLVLMLRYSRHGLAQADAEAAEPTGGPGAAAPALTY